MPHPHPDPDQHQNLTTCRWSPLARAYRRRTSVTAFVSYPAHRQNERSHNSASLGGVMYRFQWCFTESYTDNLHSHKSYAAAQRRQIRSYVSHATKSIKVWLDHS